MATMQTLVEQFMPLANKLASKKKKTLPKFIDFEELQSAAYLGLVEAASRYDDTMGVTFQTFAYQRIWGAIIDHLRQFGLQPLSLDTCDEDGNTLGEMIEAREERNDFDETLEVVTKDLGDNAHGMLKLYFEEDLPMKEVGMRFGVSESRVSQIFSSYKKSIRQSWSESELRAELAA